MEAHLTDGILLFRIEINCQKGDLTHIDCALAGVLGFSMIPKVKATRTSKI